MDLIQGAPTDDAPVSERFGPYLVLDRIGVGGMATVHRAKQIGLEGLERLVALKRMLPHMAEDEELVRGFVREAKLASLLRHSNIAQIYRLGRIDGVYYIAMELVPGVDVRRVLQHCARAGTPPPLPVVVGLLMQLCDALDHAHAATDHAGTPLGMVHRDISPSNLLITPSGHLKVIDFGIARAQTAQLATRTGRIKGKLGYMPPEVFDEGAVDHRCDLFAVGVVAHELLTARPLFTAKAEYQTIINVRQKHVRPPSESNPHVPAELDAIVARALAKSRDDRWSTGGELADALHDVCRVHGIDANQRGIARWFKETGVVEANGRRRWPAGTRSRSVSTSSPALLGRCAVGTAPPDAGGDRSAPRTVPDSQPRAATGAGIPVEPPAQAPGGGSAPVARPAPPRLRTAPPQPSAVEFRDVEPHRAPAVARARTSTEVMGVSLPPPSRARAKRLALALLPATLILGVALLLSSAFEPSPVEAKPAMVRVEVVPADATVRLGAGPPRPPGAFALDPGSYRVEILREGYRSYTGALELSAGATVTHRVVLERVEDQRARLRIQTPPGTELRIDGQVWTAARSESIRLEPGAHLVEVLADGRVAWTHELDAEPGTAYELTPAIEGPRRTRRRSRAKPRRRRRPR